jgi:phenylacetate-CoA ligase
LTTVRQRTFLGIDRLRGGTVSAHIADIEAVVADPGGSESGERQDAHLRDLLSHVGATVPFYRDLALSGLGRDVFEDLPVVDKQVYVDHYDDLCSSAFDIGTLPMVYTSGSTATPLRVPRDPGKRKRHIADLIVFGRLASYDFGDPVLFLTVSRGLDGRSFRQRLQGVRYVRAQVFDDTLVAALIGEIDRSSDPIYLFGFPSAFEYVGRRLADNGRHLAPGNLSGLMAISEANTPWLTAHGEETFGAPVFSRYANEENGILAQQTTDAGGRFVVNHASYVVEILALDSDRPVPEGDLGRIVITDLFSRAMPFIRYDTGDLGRMCAEHPYDLAEVVGRRGDLIYGEQGQAIAPAAVLYKLLPFDDIRRFQFAQTDRLSHRLTVVAAEDSGRDAAIETALRDLLGAGASVTIEYVEDIDSMPSGKRRPVANLWEGGGR